MSRAAACGAALAVLAVFPAPAPAPVPPKDCGFMTVKDQRYNVRADQLRCKQTRKRAKAFLRRGKKPKRFSCTRYPKRQTAIAFRCSRGKREIIVIRR